MLRKGSDYILYKVTVVLVLTTLFTGGVLVASRVSAETMTTRASVTVSESCSMTATEEEAHTATVENGRYVSEIGETVLRAYCNDAEGFKIYAIGYTDDTYGKTVLTSAKDSTYDIVTGTATSGSTSNWAMKLTTDASAAYPVTLQNGFGSYSAVPSQYTLVAIRESMTDVGAAATGASLSATYAAFISGTQIADTYVGQVKYTMVHPNANDPYSYMVNFYANGGSGTMSSQKITVGTATALTANSFTGPGDYIFDGWNTARDGSGTYYTDAESVTDIAEAGSTISLYAQWTKVWTMQEFATSEADTTRSRMTTGDTITLIDSRDNKTYLVGKLADGNFWMMDNLALDLSDSSVQTNLSSSTTNATDEALDYLINGGGSSPYPTTGLKAITASGGSWTNSYNIPYIATGKDGTDYTTLSVTSYGKGSGKVGIYYNYCAASAGSYCYTRGNGVDKADTLIDAPYDICPAGWRMPTSTSNGEYRALYTAYSSVADSLRVALSTPLSGYFYDGSAFSQGSYGYFWSSTYDGGSGMYYLYVNSSSVGPSNGNGYRYYGYSVRCLLSS